MVIPAPGAPQPDPFRDLRARLESPAPLLMPATDAPCEHGRQPWEWCVACEAENGGA